jgi:UV DNA damage repair endonuclease
MTEVIRRIGSACKVVYPDDPVRTKAENFKTTTLAYLNRLANTEDILLKLVDIVLENLRRLDLHIQRLSQYPIEMRMFRIGSDLLPMYGHAIASEFYNEYRLNLIRTCLERTGNTARTHGIRLSFHPAQHVVIASPNPIAAENGIAELERVCQIAGWMGYIGWHPHGFAVNIHAGAASVTTQQLRDVITNRLSEQARNLLTLENDEFSHGLYQLCELSDVVAIVPDLHHHWIRNEILLSPDDPSLTSVIESWRGVRPKLHLAMSRQHLIPEGFDVMGYRALQTLTDTHGLAKTKLRAHSDSPWNIRVLDYARRFWDQFDILWEGKDKNLGQQIIYEHFIRNERQE